LRIKNKMMSVQFDDLVAVSGMSGLFKMVANRPNGLIIEEIDSGKKKLAPSRKHQFTPLASIGIYTGPKDTTELAEVFRNMKDQLESNPPVDPSKASGTELASYFEQILPDYDPDRVFAGDIKKVIKWFTFLNERDLIPAKEEKEEVEKAEKTKIVEEASESAD